MKALTLHQPWATLLVSGAKIIETRSWSTHHNGLLAIHASKNSAFLHLCYQLPFSRGIVAAGFNTPGELPLGAMVGTVLLTRCLPTERIRILSNQERVFGDFRKGRFAWITKEFHRLEHPIPCRGRQRLWNIPVEISRKMRSVLAEQTQ